MLARNSGEVRNPRAICLCRLLFATAIIAIMYLLIQIVSIGDPPSLAINSDRPLAEAAGIFMGSREVLSLRSAQ